MARLRRRACIALFLFTLFVFGTMMGLRTLKPSDGFSDLAPGLELLPAMAGKVDRRSVSRDATASPGQVRPADSNTHAVLSNSGPEGTIFYDVHIFYYTWYGNPSMDGKYIHWDHILVPHWDPKIASSYPRGRHAPPEDIGSSFYPELNPYSSRDPDVLESHMEQIGASAAGKKNSSVLLYSFWPLRSCWCGTKTFQHHASSGQLPKVPTCLLLHFKRDFKVVILLLLQYSHSTSHI